MRRVNKGICSNPSASPNRFPPDLTTLFRLPFGQDNMPRCLSPCLVCVCPDALGTLTRYLHNPMTHASFSYSFLLSLTLLSLVTLNLSTYFTFNLSGALRCTVSQFSLVTTHPPLVRWKKVGERGKAGLTKRPQAESKQPLGLSRSNIEAPAASMADIDEWQIKAGEKDREKKARGIQRGGKNRDGPTITTRELWRTRLMFGL